MSNVAASIWKKLAYKPCNIGKMAKTKTSKAAGKIISTDSARSPNWKRKKSPLFRVPRGE
jgi:hypothetical protein